jgi:hypothetical protein
MLFIVTSFITVALVYFQVAVVHAAASLKRKECYALYCRFSYFSKLYQKHSPS